MHAVLAEQGHRAACGGQQMSALEQRLYDALKLITRYEPPDKLRRIAERRYGLTGEEAIEMAYENVLFEARNAVLGMRRPKAQGSDTGRGE
jgi:hypothetical protein